MDPIYTVISASLAAASRNGPDQVLAACWKSKSYAITQDRLDVCTGGR